MTPCSSSEPGRRGRGVAGEQWKLLSSQMRIVEFLLVSDLWIVTFEVSAKNLPTDPLARQWMVINLFHCGNLETFCFLVTLCPSPALVGSWQTLAKADSRWCPAAQMREGERDGWCL